MNTELKRALLEHETDIEEALGRLYGDEDLYAQCLKMFMEDQTIHELTQAIRIGSWDDAFTAAHALKGLAGNMGFVPLYHSAAEIVIMIRSGRTLEASAYLREVSRCYDEISEVIRKFGAEIALED